MDKITIVKIALLLTIIFTSLLSCRQQETLKQGTTGILERTIKVEGKNFPYYVYLPADYTPEKKWPVLLYLHGSGPVGNVWSIAGGLGNALQKSPERFPCIVVFPECPPPRFWIGVMNRYAVAAVDQTVKEFNGDDKRLYVTGFSMGGYGTWICAVNNPGRFAALAPVAGGVIPPFEFSGKERKMVSPHCLAVLDAEDPYKALANIVGKTPSWVFHGAQDDVVPVSESQKVAAALKANGGNAEYTEYPNMGHEVEGVVYFREDFVEWLFEQRLE